MGFRKDPNCRARLARFSRSRPNILLYLLTLNKSKGYCLSSAMGIPSLVHRMVGWGHPEALHWRTTFVFRGSAAVVLIPSSVNLGASGTLSPSSVSSTYSSESSPCLQIQISSTQTILKSFELKSISPCFIKLPCD